MDNMRIARDTDSARMQTASDFLAEQRGKTAIEKLAPKRRDWPDEIPIVSVFLNPPEAADFLVASLWFRFGDAIMKDEPMDWSKPDPVLELEAYRISVNGRGRSDISRIGEPAKLGYIEPQKQKQGWLRRRFKRGEE